LATHAPASAAAPFPSESLAYAPASSNSNGFRLGYRSSLDGLRGVAVLAVMAFHLGFGWARGGFLGVDVFFVLSGFLITTLLMQEWEQTQSISLARFYARRGLRLLPALVLQLLVLILMPGLVTSGAVAWKIALIVFFYSANWVSAFRLYYLDVFQPTWSLAIEEQFYLLWPPLLKLMRVLGLGRLHILLIVIVGIEVSATTRMILWQPTNEGWARAYFGLDTRMDSLLLGCLVGLLAAWNMLPKGKWLRIVRTGGIVAFAILAVLFHVVRDSSPEFFHGIGLLACIAVAVVLVALVTSPPAFITVVLEWPALVAIGRISYGLYLWHFPIFYGVLTPERAARWGIPASELASVKLLAVFAVAAASYFLIEQPALILKEYFGKPHQQRTRRAALHPVFGHLTPEMPDTDLFMQRVRQHFVQPAQRLKEA
jgi:peptidoglycan/LPS O-acetylase OafA/YrhL